MMRSQNNVAASPLSARLKKFLVDEKHTDCSFTFAQCEPLYCHKLILSTASPVFEAMFYGPMAETSARITIKDVSRDVFLQMLDYIYTDEITNTTKKACCYDLIDLYICADKYLITDLANNCLRDLRDALRLENIFAVLDMTVELDIQPMIRACLSFFNSCCLSSISFNKILSWHYEHISKATLIVIVSNGLSFTRNVIALVREWCENELKLSVGLTDEQFVEMVKSLNLSPEMLESVLASADEREKLTLYNGKCPISSRWTFCQRTYYKAVPPLRLEGRRQTEDLTRFYANHTIELHAITINTRLTPFMKNVPTTYTERLTVQILDTESNCVAYEQIFNCKDVEYNSTVRLILDVPIRIPCLVLYTIRLIWQENAGVAIEYPRSLYSECERGRDCIISFFEKDSDLPHCGSVLTGLEYDHERSAL